MLYYLVIGLKIIMHCAIRYVPDYIFIYLQCIYLFPGSTLSIRPNILEYDIYMNTILTK